jgi:predicted dehydrogenase
MAFRVGMVGVDGHITYVLDGIPKLRDVRLVAYSKGQPDDDLEPLRRHPAVTQRTRFYENYEEMFDKEELDIVGVCMPYYRNAEVSTAAATRGIHIVSEKPIATTVEQLRKLQTSVRTNKVRLTAMFGMRLLPVFQAARKIVESGTIWEPTLATGQKSYKFGPRPEWYRLRDTYGGTLLWVGIHAVDFVRYCTGLEYTRVAAFHSNMGHPHIPELEDTANVILQFANGGSAAISIDYFRPSKAPTHGDDRLRIVGTKGIVEIKDNATRVELVTRKQGPRNVRLRRERQFFVDFVAELRGEKQHVIRPNEPFRLNYVCLVAREAADRGEVLSCEVGA